MKNWLTAFVLAIALCLTGCSFFNPEGTAESTAPVPTVHKELITTIGESTTVNNVEVGFVNMEYDGETQDLVLYFHYNNKSDDYSDIGMNEVTVKINGNSTRVNFYGCHLNAGEESDGKALISMPAKNENMTIELYYYQEETPFLQIKLNMSVSTPTPAPSTEETTTETTG